MKLKNIIAGVCLFALIAVPVLSTSVDVYASGGNYLHFTSEHGDTEGTMEVEADVKSTWQIQVPAIIGLDQVVLPGYGHWNEDTQETEWTNIGTCQYKGDYEIRVSALIPDSKKIIIFPMTSEFSMIGANTGASASATIEQEKTNLMNDILDDELTDALLLYTENSAFSGMRYGDISGTISVTFDTVDTYSGNIGFSFGLVDKL